MNAAGRLALYAAALALIFGAAFVIAGAFAPEDIDSASEQSTNAAPHGAHGGAAEPSGDSGLALSSGGLQLANLSAPTDLTAGELSLQIQNHEGTPVADYDVEHDAKLHLIVVRADGSEFRHVHPELAGNTWKLPWQWDAAGTYRIYADFVPAGGEPLTLSQTVQVEGDFTPVIATPTMHDAVAGFDVTLDGTLTPGETNDLTVTIERDGEPVTKLEPYLGSFGHLVALRDGDLAYLHVHPEGAEPAAADTGGPTIGFAAEVPTAGRYLLYLDFQVDGTVHTASFVIDAEHRETAATHSPNATEPSDEHGSHDDH